MKKCIDLEIAASIVCEMCEGFYPDEACRKEECEWIQELHAHAVRDDAPAEDVAPMKYGRWEFLGPNMLNRDCMCGTCSACKVRSKYVVNAELCPNCGARMDGDAKDGT